MAIPAPDAVHLLVASLADESPAVRAASLAALSSVAALNPLLVLDCCSLVARAPRRRFPNMAGVFTVMAGAVRAMEGDDVDPPFMGKLAKIATAEMITSKELNADWQRAAAALLVSIGSHVPDLMMEEIFLHLCGPSSAQPAMVQILADFASTEAFRFAPRLKDVLLRVLPILGSVRDNHRPIFANAFKCWCQAAWQYIGDFPCHQLLDSDVMSCLNSAFELVLRVWATSRDLKIAMVGSGTDQSQTSKTDFHIPTAGSGIEQSHITKRMPNDSRGRGKDQSEVSKRVNLGVPAQSNLNSVPRQSSLQVFYRSIMPPIGLRNRHSGISTQPSLTRQPRNNPMVLHGNSPILSLGKSPMVSKSSRHQLVKLFGLRRWKILVFILH